ncbi:PRC-barrel domain-containing protein [Actinoplanes sp. KI2]|uniref:PRC-barrel domain-containing protein n=1 Tax=Actinoplanes sp. KI2 TaxID=2983315 RepID=UPI0021D59DA0|nr:PRC-barrel domain-containing protein [Actinoplanes sp. KI2]MCU7726275.1 PRC-barrel domain-containing protein [Actinoplanes sp. KI2]
MPRGRVGDLIGRAVADVGGEPLGRIADLVTDDHNRITAVIVVRGRWGRLLGYERDEMRGPWLLEQFARRVWRRNAVEIPWERLRRDGTGVPLGLG